MAQVIPRNRRRDHRRRLPPIELMLGGVKGYLSRDWSLGGFAAFGPSESFRVGDVLTGRLRAPESDADWLSFEAIVTRSLPQHRFVAARFDRLSPECFAFLEGRFRRPALDLMSGLSGSRRLWP